MIERKEFTIENPPVKGEVTGNETSGKVIVLSHGFGVRRDSRGMFTELAEKLKADSLVVMFDYVQVDDEGNTTATAPSKQAEMLSAVLEKVRTEHKPEEIDIIAHSQGCLAVGTASPDNVNTVVLIASPTSPPAERMKEYFGKREGTDIDEDGMSKIKRSDGTTTYIPSDFWKEASEVNPIDLYANLAKKANKVYFVRAKQDHVVTDEDYSEIKANPDIEFIEIDGNHDFESQDRKKWLETMAKLIENG